MNIEGISDNTLKHYLYKINLLHNKINNCNYSNLTFLNDYNKIIDIIYTNYQYTSSRLSFLIAICSLTRRHNMNVYKYYYKIMMLLKKDLDIKTDLNILNKKERKNYLDYADLIEIEHKDNIFYKMIYNLILYLPPKRSNEYSLIKVSFKKEIPQDTNYNYYMVNMKLLIYNVHKNSKVDGALIIDLKNKDTNLIKYARVKKILNEYILYEKLKEGDFLFKGKKNMTYLIKKVFTFKEKSPNLNLIRHSFITYIHKLNLNLYQLKQIALLMGHNLSQQLKYRKCDDDMTVIFD